MSRRARDRIGQRVQGSLFGSLSASLLPSSLRSLFGSLLAGRRSPAIADGHAGSAAITDGEISINLNLPRPGGLHGA